VMNAGARGVKIICSGRLSGSEMARRETQKIGSIPLHTLDADVDYAIAVSKTTYGTIGVKVWVYRGKYGEQREQTRVVRRRRRVPARRHGGEAAVVAAGSALGETVEQIRTAAESKSSDKKAEKPESGASDKGTDSEGAT